MGTASGIGSLIALLGLSHPIYVDQPIAFPILPAAVLAKGPIQVHALVIG